MLGGAAGFLRLVFVYPGQEDQVINSVQIFWLVQSLYCTKYHMVTQR